LRHHSKRTKNGSMNSWSSPHQLDPPLVWEKTRFPRSLLCACAVALFATGSFLAPANASCPVSFQGLGQLPGDVASQGLALSNDGRVVGGASFDASGAPHAFRWRSEHRRRAFRTAWLWRPIAMAP